jgi:hypothetical protein
VHVRRVRRSGWCCGSRCAHAVRLLPPRRWQRRSRRSCGRGRVQVGRQRPAQQLHLHAGCGAAGEGVSPPDAHRLIAAATHRWCGRHKARARRCGRRGRRGWRTPYTPAATARGCSVSPSVKSRRVQHGGRVGGHRSRRAAHVRYALAWRGCLGTRAAVCVTYTRAVDWGGGVCGVTWTPAAVARRQVEVVAAAAGCEHQCEDVAGAVPQQERVATRSVLAAVQG